MTRKKQPPEDSIVRSSAAEDLTFVAATCSQQQAVEMRYEDEKIRCLHGLSRALLRCNRREDAAALRRPQGRSREAHGAHLLRLGDGRLRRVKEAGEYGHDGGALPVSIAGGRRKATTASTSCGGFARVANDGRSAEFR